MQGILPELGGRLLDATVGYGYRPWLAAICGMVASNLYPLQCAAAKSHGH
jgi:hypothetical protein